MASCPGELFVSETYATVYRTAYVDETEKNGDHIIMGGWQYLSPLEDKKLKSYGYADRFELFSKEGAKLVFRKGDGLEPEIMDAYLKRVYGTGINPVKELPGDLVVYIIE